jgi:O-methyltransferase
MPNNMPATFKFLLVRLLRKCGKFAGYRLDFTPESITHDREKKFAYLARLAARAGTLPGDFVECGLGNGFSFARLAEEGHRARKKLYGFDSFQGFPKLAPEDASSYAVKEGDWSAVDIRTVAEKVLACVPADYYEREVRITAGFFTDTLATVEIDRISFLHLDVDLYQSYLDCLEHFYEKVVPGGIIAIDELINDFEYVKYPGAFIAISQFFKGRDADVCRDLETGKYYIVKR